MKGVLVLLVGILLGVINGVIVWKIADFIGSSVLRFLKILIGISENE